MTDANHCDVTLKSDDAEEKAIETLKTAVLESTRVLANTLYSEQFYKVFYTKKIYRKMCEAEVESVLNIMGLVNEYDHKYKWVTECLEKVLKFQNKDVPESIRITEKILQMSVDKTFWTTYRKRTIPQLNSCLKQQQSIYNYEGILPRGARSFETVGINIKRNVGIHANDLKNFNKNIKSIKVLDPIDQMGQNGFLRCLSNNRSEIGLFALSTTMIFLANALSEPKDDFHFRRKITITLCTLVGSTIGTVFGSALGSLVPGSIPEVNACFGSIIFGRIGEKIGEWLMARNHDLDNKTGLSKQSAEGSVN